MRPESPLQRQQYKLRSSHVCSSAVSKGFSQGGAIATVAAIALSEYDPILITYGQHLVAWKGCDVLNNMETYLRFMGMCEFRGQPAYDAVSFYGNPLLTTHYGTKILLGQGGAVTISGERTFLPIMPQCHNLEDSYLYVIDHLLEAGLLNGFIAGAMCTQDVECESNVCSQRRCVS